jgi:N utilization substance protein B
MSTRRDAREFAVQMLFELDLNPSDRLETVFASFWKEREADEGARDFAQEIVTGVRRERIPIDDLIKSISENWDIRRMGVLDRNVIRMAVYEMLHHKDVPAAVTINEAVDIAKYFSSGESGKFVNGVLDRIRKELKLPARLGEPGDSGAGRKARKTRGSSPAKPEGAAAGPLA